MSGYQRSTDPKKKCMRCRHFRLLDEFAEDPEHQSGYRPYCRVCERKVDGVKVSSKDQRAYSRYRTYGLTPEAYAELLARHDGLCALCSNPPAEGKQLTIDHDHHTGLVRALLCHSCNWGLGHFKENPELLRAAADYIEAHRL